MNQNKDGDRKKNTDGEIVEISFSSVIMSLATQALIQMGEVPPPEGVPAEKDLEGARQTIDIIAMLEKKTRGNLDDSELKLLEEVLHQLRMSFVAR